MAITVRRTQSARDNNVQDGLYARIDFNTVALTSGKQYVGVVPQNAYAFETVVRVNTTFDQPLVVGTSATTNAYVRRDDVAWDATGATHVDRAGNLSTTAGDVSVYVLATTVPTVGQADIWVRFLKAK